MLEEISTTCPYCGEPVQLLVDISGGDQHYFEDCQICCRPISIMLTMNIGDANYSIVTRRDDD